MSPRPILVHQKTGDRWLLYRRYRTILRPNGTVGYQAIESDDLTDQVERIGQYFVARATARKPSAA